MICEHTMHEFQRNLDSVSTSTLRIAGDVLERKNAFVFLGDRGNFTRFTGEVDLAIAQLKHLRECIRYMKLG